MPLNVSYFFMGGEQVEQKSRERERAKKKISTPMKNDIVRIIQKKKAAHI